MTIATVNEPDTGSRRWRITTDEFERMVAAGVFDEDDSIELLDGELYEMAPAGDWHNAGVDSLARTLTMQAGDVVLVRSQGSLRLDETSAPEPDVTVLRLRADYYRSGGPERDDILLIVEVSDTTIRHDRDTKLPLYARAGIPEVWIVTREPAAIQVHRAPRAGVYTQTSIYFPGDAVSPALLPGATVAVSDITG